MLEPTTNGFVGSDPWTFTFKTLAILSQCMVSMQFHYSELKLTRPAIFCANIFFKSPYELDTLINNVAMTNKAVKLTVTFASKCSP